MMSKKGIPHFESMSLEDMLLFFEEPQNYSVAEKLDGYNLRIGCDADGKLYISRETKGSRVYYLDEEIDPYRHPNIFRRVIQQYLKQVPFELSAGTEIVVEVLMDEVPNVVPYVKDLVQIVYLYTTHDTGVIRTGGGEFDYHTVVEVEIDVPDLDNVGKLHKKTFNCVFHTSDIGKHVSIKNTAIMEEFKDKISNLLDTVVVPGYTVQMLYSLPKNKSAYAWDFKTTKTNIQLAQAITDDFKPEIMRMKEYLLDIFVWDETSAFGPEDGFIEGVVLTHYKSFLQKRFKLVCKKTYTTMKDKIWDVRDRLFFLRQEYINGALDEPTYEYLLNKYSTAVTKVGIMTIDDAVTTRNREAVWDMLTELSTSKAVNNT